MKNDNKIKLHRMNIYSVYGDKIIFDSPNNGYPYDQEKARKHLKVGGIYTVVGTNVHDSSTDVFIAEVPGIPFNSVFFGDLTQDSIDME